MNSKIFGNLNTFFEMYVCLSKCPLSRESLVKKMKEAGKKSSSVSDYVNKAINGDIAFISGTEEKLMLDHEALAQFLLEACGEMKLEAQIHPQGKKKDGDEYSAGPVTNVHSQNFEKMNKQLNDANADLKKLKSVVEKQAQKIQELQEELLKNVSVAIVENMDMKVLVPASVKSAPPKIFAKDFFLDNPVAELDEEKLVSKYGGILDGIYRPLAENVPEITEESYWRRICQRFTSGKLFQKRLEDQTALTEVNSMECSSLDKNRIHSINMLLQDESLDNQTKLSTYAFWYFHDDPEMEELLVFAGEHGINANYAIQLLEKPEELRNYRTMRGFLKQVQMSSEAHIKREAAQELLCGEWKVIADYCGKPCEFKMVPVDELLLFRKSLEECKVPKALTSVKKLLESTFGPMDQKLEGADDKTEKVKDIAPPPFLHPESMDVDEHAQPDGDEGFDDFAEKELPNEE